MTDPAPKDPSLAREAAAARGINIAMVLILAGLAMAFALYAAIHQAQLWLAAPPAHRGEHVESLLAALGVLGSALAFGLGWLRDTRRGPKG